MLMGLRLEKKKKDFKQGRQGNPSPFRFLGFLRWFRIVVKYQTKFYLKIIQNQSSRFIL